MSVALISIGSNLGNSKENVTVAIKALGKLDDCRMLAFSSFYLTKPWGYKEQPDFINCACKLETGLDPLSLLHCMQKLEQDFHRVRNLKYGPRTLDLDLIAFDFQNGDLDIVVDDDCFVLLTGQCQHLTHPPFRISGCRIPDILPGIYLPQG